MDYKKKLKQRLHVSLFYLVLGLILMLVDIWIYSENSFVFSFGVAMLVMGLSRILRYRKIIKDEKYMRKQELIEKDERLLMLSERAKSWAFSFSLTIAGLAVIVLSLLGYDALAQPLAWYVCGLCVLYWIFWLILGKKY